MSEPARKNKKNISYSISESLYGQVYKLMETGDFSSFSDIVNTALIDYTAKYEYAKMTKKDNTMLLFPKIKSKKTQRKQKISVTLNSFIIQRTRIIKREMRFDTYSDVVSHALYIFLETYKNPENLQKNQVQHGVFVYPENTNKGNYLVVSEEQLKNMINDEFRKALEKHNKLNDRIENNVNDQI